MAITFIEKRKRSRYLVFIFLAILVAIIIIVLRPVISDFLVGVKPLILPPLEVTERKIEIDFEVFADPLLIVFRSFEFPAFPRPEAKDVSLTPTLEWQSVSEAEIYEWEIFGVESGQTEQTSVTVTKELEPSTTYVWRVKSCTKEDICSTWSGDCQTKENLGCWRFTTIERDPLVLTSPSSEAKDVSLTPTLEWQSVSEAEIYEWEIFGVESGQTEQTSVTVTKELEPSTTYVWRVKSCTKEDICSTWSAQVFTTTFVILPPDLVAPFEKEIIEKEVIEEETTEGEEGVEELREVEEVGRENPFIFY